MSHNDDLPYAELALGAGMAFLIRRFTKKDQQTGRIKFIQECEHLVIS